jgi:tetratricopeptide (TPR) repeat protein
MCLVLRLALGLMLLCCGNIGYTQSGSEARADSLRLRARNASTPAEASDRWLELSKHFRKSNLDSSQAALDHAIAAARQSADTDRQTRCNMSQAALKWMQGDFATAEKGYTQALYHWRRKNDTLEVARCLLNLGTVCQAAHKDTQAATYLKTALNLAQRGKQVLIAAQAAGSIATVSFQMGEPDSVRIYSEIAIQGFSTLHDSANLARAHANLGYYYRELGMSYEARQPYLEALQLLETSDDASLQGEIHEGYGTLEHRLGNFDVAVSHFLIARDHFTRLHWHKRIADNNNLLGNCLITMGRRSAAREYFAEAFRLADSIDNYGIAASALSNIADMDREDGHHARAALAYKKAIHLQSIAPQQDAHFHQLLGLGISDFALGLRDSADHFLKLAMAEAYRHNSANQIAEVHAEFAQQALKARQYRPAMASLDSAYRWYGIHQNAAGLQHVFSLRSQCREAMGDFVGALQDQRIASQWQDSVHAFSANSQLLNLEAKFWSEKKQHSLDIAKQNEALQAKEAERSQESSAKLAAQRNLLITALVLTVVFAAALYWINLRRRKTQLSRKLAEMRMTALRTQMNPHFIFNALGSVQLLINTSAIHEANLYLSKFAQLLRTTLERSDSENSTLQDEIEALKLYIDLEALRFKFRYTLEVDSALDPESILFPTLLLQPIVENAVKHGLAAKPENGTLAIMFSLVGQDLCCTIEDNGVGRSGVKKRIAENDTERRSFGIQITQERLLLLQPTHADRLQIIDLSDANGKPVGTRVVIKLPLQLH